MFFMPTVMWRTEERQLRVLPSGMEFNSSGVPRGLERITRLDWPASLRDPPVCISSELRLQVYTAMHCVLTPVLGRDLRPSCFHTSIAPTVILFITYNFEKEHHQ